MLKRISIAAAAAVLAIPAYAAEQGRVMLACEGGKLSVPGGGINPVSTSVIIDFNAMKIFSDIAAPLDIDHLSERKISARFEGSLNGQYQHDLFEIDRITGEMSGTTYTKLLDGKTKSGMDTIALECRPTQQMF